MVLFLPSTPVNHASNASSMMGVVIPLYIYPGPSWQQVIQEKQANPGVPIVAVINPDSGPGASQDPYFVEGIEQLQSAGIIVVGYVYTNYGYRSISSAENDVNEYKEWYNVDGILFDEMANVNGFEDYYSTLNSYAKSLGFSLTIANPGTLVSSTYFGIVDCLVISESSDVPSADYIESSLYGYSPRNFAIVSYDVSTLNQTYLNDLSNYVSFIYMTNDNLPNPYDTLPSYFGSLVHDVSSTNGSSTSSSSGESETTATINVNSLALNGTTFSGMWTTVQLNGDVLATGYTPLTFTGTIGVQYTVTVANFRGYVFRNWEGGIPNPSDTFKLTHDVVIALNQNVALQAYYNTPTNATNTSSSSTSSSTFISLSSSSTSLTSHTSQSTTTSTTTSQTSESQYEFPQPLLLPLAAIMVVAIVAVSLVTMSARTSKASLTSK